MLLANFRGKPMRSPLSGKTVASALGRMARSAARRRSRSRLIRVFTLDADGDAVEAVDQHRAHWTWQCLVLAVHEVIDDERTPRRRAEQLAQADWPYRIAGVEIPSVFSKGRTLILVQREGQESAA